MLLPAANFHLYRVKTARRAREQRLLDETDADVTGNDIIKQAIGQAIDDNIDVVNLSLGRLHKFCQGCVFDGPIAQLHENGATVVAAIGNEHERRRHEHVLCPALTDEAVSVGGVTNHCRAPVSDRDADRRIWADTEMLPRVPEDRQGPYCSFRGCTAGTKSCAEYRSETPADCNIRSYRGNPEILAPAQKPEYVDEENGYVAFAKGTSFAAPLVAATAARLRAQFQTAVSPATIREALLSGSDTIHAEQTTYERLNAKHAQQVLQQRVTPPPTEEE